MHFVHSTVDLVMFLVMFLCESLISQEFGVHPFGRTISLASWLFNAVSVVLVTLVVGGVVFGFGHLAACV